MSLTQQQELVEAVEALVDAKVDYALASFAEDGPAALWATEAAKHVEVARSRLSSTLRGLIEKIT